MTRCAADKWLLAGTLLVSSLTVYGCGDSLTSLNKLAASGSIRRDAPVKAHLQIDVAAPPRAVWMLLIDASAWPTWAPQIASVDSAEPLANGQSFNWETWGSIIHSQVQLFEPEHGLGWTGTALTAKAVHIWELAPGLNGGTTVTVNESLEGPFMKALYPSAKLEDADREWLSALKSAAEKTPWRLGRASLAEKAFKKRTQMTSAAWSVPVVS